LKSRYVHEERDEERDMARNLYWYIPLMIMPFLTGYFLNEMENSYWIYLLCLVGVNIISMVGMDILTGLAGQLSLGHASFMAIGGYVYAIAVNDYGLQFLPASLLGGISASFVAIFLALLACRLEYLYLAIATMGFAFITEEMILLLKTVTRGVEGMAVSSSIRVLGFEVTSKIEFYYLVYVIVILAIVIGRRILNTKLGRAFISIRDSDTAAKVLGVNLFQYKLLAFTIGAFYAGVAGSLYGITIGYLGPSDFTVSASIYYLVMLVVGGMGYIYGSVSGAIAITLLPEIIRYGKDIIGLAADIYDLQALMYGLIMLVFIVAEPTGIYGRWRKIRFYWKAFPFNKEQKQRVAWIRRWY